MDTALKKARLAARWEWLNLYKGYTKDRHCSLALVVYRLQINTDWHRLRAKGYDQDDY